MKYFSNQKKRWNSIGLMLLKPYFLFFIYYGIVICIFNKNLITLFSQYSYILWLPLATFIFYLIGKEVTWILEAKPRKNTILEWISNVFFGILVVIALLCMTIIILIQKLIFFIGKILNKLYRIRKSIFKHKIEIK